MKYVWVGALVFGNLLFARTQDSETNINTRYTVETVIVSGNGWTTDVAAEHDPKFSGTLSKRLSSLIGDKLNPSALDEVGRRLRKELNARAVTRHVLRGGARIREGRLQSAGARQPLRRFGSQIPLQRPTGLERRRGGFRDRQNSTASPSGW